jgi:o-succinylbenzoate synthase
MTGRFFRYELVFKEAAGTSRGVLNSKATYFLIIQEGNNTGIGECALFKGLSADDREDYENTLQWACNHLHLGEKELIEKLTEFPSIQFGLEQAFLSVKKADKYELFPSSFTAGKSGIPINGLVWMGDKAFMEKQIKEKIENGFDTIKLKIGAIDFDDELDLLSSIRKNFSEKEITLRLDANGAFLTESALENIKRLSEYKIHSLEQPIKAGQWQEMANICERSPVPIALDEELIGIFDSHSKKALLECIKPQFIILKPSLVGGFSGSLEWIVLAGARNIPWWITSALESNIGLNAIAQFTFTLNSPLPQGLGTGSLFTHNIKSPLVMEKGKIYYRAGEENYAWVEPFPV